MSNLLQYLHDMLCGMRFSGLRSLVVVFAALLFATGPALSTFASAQAVNPHAGMAMSDPGSDDGCCDHSIPDDTTLCSSHCAAGFIDVSIALAVATAISIPVTTLFVLPSASHAPVPDTAPPKSSIA